MLNFFIPEIPYEVIVYTGNATGAGTDANVVLTLCGEKGKSDEFKLRNKTDNFENGKVDKFKVGWFAVCTNILYYFH